MDSSLHFVDRSKVCGTIEVIVGPMFSGKTTLLLKKIDCYLMQGLKCIIINHAINKRYGKFDCVTTHDFKKANAVTTETLDDLRSLMKEIDVIGIDEGQFFSNIANFSNDLANEGKKIIIAGLDLTYQNKGFGEIPQLLALANSVIKLKAKCVNCYGVANFTFRYSKEDEVVIIGSNDKYVSVCRNCYNYFVNKDNLTNFSSNFDKKLKIDKSLSVKKGIFVTIEGCDKSGKTTQTTELLKKFNASSQTWILIKFPDRTTQIGTIINQYLKNKNMLDEQTIHLLFSANRWEKFKTIKNYLNQGVNVISDRYSHSGIAYSMANNLDYNWCSQTENGLIEPDLVLFLNIKPNLTLQRQNSKREKYENINFQTKVNENYFKLVNCNWIIINANRDFNTVNNELYYHIQERIESLQTQTNFCN